MGREAKLLLGILAMLAGVFVGVVSMKMLVPRPPAGAGPDIHASALAIPPQDIVEPPRLAVTPASTPRPDPVVTVAALEEAASAGMSDASAPPDRAAAAGPGSFPPPGVDVGTFLPVDEAPTAVDEPIAPAAFGVAGDDAAPYVTRPGDSWWQVAERAYGDGRLYRALFAWNRVLDPRVSLVPGTPLEIPPLEKLASAWPGLMPR